MVNFNVYLDDATMRRLDALARRRKVARNALIREAVASLLSNAGSTWPAGVLAFEGDPDTPPFESQRTELSAPSEDPFAARPASKLPPRSHRGSRASRR